MKAETIHLGEKGRVDISATSDAFPLGERGKRPLRFTLYDDDLFRKVKELEIPGVISRGARVDCAWDAAHIVASAIGEPDALKGALAERLSCKVPFPGKEEYERFGFKDKLYDYQREDVRFLLRRAYAILGELPRAGKCVVIIATFVACGARRLLILCNALGKYVWGQEVAKWLDDEAVLLFGRAGTKAHVYCKHCVRGNVAVTGPASLLSNTPSFIPCPACAGQGERIYLVHTLERVTEARVWNEVSPENEAKYLAKVAGYEAKCAEKKTAWNAKWEWKWEKAPPLKLPKRPEPPKGKRRVEHVPVEPPLYRCPVHTDETDLVERQCSKCKNEMLAVMEKARIVVCFPRGTLVRTPNGPQEIQGLQVGDEVLSRDEHGHVSSKRVSKTFTSTAKELVRLRFSSGFEIVCTPEHPFLVEGSVWVKARDLLRRRIIRQRDWRTEQERPLSVLAEGGQRRSGRMLALDRLDGDWGLRSVHVPPSSHQGSSILLRGLEGSSSTRNGARPYLWCSSLCKSGPSGNSDAKGEFASGGWQEESKAFEEELRLGTPVHTREYNYPARRSADVADMSNLYGGEKSTLQRRGQKQSLGDGQTRKRQKTREEKSSFRGTEREASPTRDPTIQRTHRGTSSGPECGRARTISSAERLDPCIGVEWLHQTTEVFNLDIEDNHTYALDGGHVVHNCNYHITIAQKEKDDAGSTMVRADLPGWGPILAKLNFEMAVASESHRLRGWTAKGAGNKDSQTIRERANEICAEIPRVYAETGTFIYGFTRDGFGQLDFISRGLWS